MPRWRTLKVWDSRLPQAEFAHNAVVNRSTGLSPFEVVYVIRSCGPTDLLAFPSPVRAEVRAADIIQTLRDTHEATRAKLVDSNMRYKAAADRHRRTLEFGVGDFIWAVLTKERFLAREYNKLAARKIGPVEIVEKVNPNAYRLKLPSHLRTSDVFNVKHLVPYLGDNADYDTGTLGLRSNLFPAGENDVEIESLNYLEAHDRIFKPKQ